ncbi:MAG: hypothetical protein KJ604_20535 [Gammaproteobacteria bacterium]|nr:hypothetical protein [Gammaproteobacteria bacterium]
MAIELVTDEILAKTTKRGHEILDLVAGKHLKVEASPDGSEILDAVVPEGKNWHVTVSIYIEETDA